MDDLEAVEFDCIAEGCVGKVLVQDYRALGYYEATGNRPGGDGNNLCIDCLAALKTARVRCLNRAVPGVDGDRGCIGDGWLQLVDLRSGQKKARWFVLHGQQERPGGTPDYCGRCLDGVVLQARCRCVGCVGDGVLRVYGGLKQAILRRGDTWPATKCDDCRAHIKRLREVVTPCASCLSSFVVTVREQMKMILSVPQPHTLRTKCDRCALVEPSELPRIRRAAHSARRRWEKQVALARMTESEEGRRHLVAASAEAFQEAVLAITSIDVDESVVREAERQEMLRRTTLGGDESLRGLAQAMTAADSEPDAISRALANPALDDRQGAALASALGVLAEGGAFPRRLIQHYRSRYDLPVTTAFAGIHSTMPKHAQAAAYEICATAAILERKDFPVFFEKRHIEAFHERVNTDPDFVACRSFESDILLGLDDDSNVLIDFKHSITGMPSVSSETLAKMEHGLTHGLLDRAIIVVSDPLPPASMVRVVETNARLAAHAIESGLAIAPVDVFVQRWPQ